MTQREIVVRLCEAYVKAGQTVEIEKIIKIADYVMAHTNDYNYSYGHQYTDWMTKNVSYVAQADTQYKALTALGCVNNTNAGICDPANEERLTADTEAISFIKL